MSDNINNRAASLSVDLGHFFATIPAGLCIVDDHYRYLWVNDTYAEITGHAVKEHCGKPLHEISPDIAVIMEPYYRQVLETGKPVNELLTDMPDARSPGVQQDWLAHHYPVTMRDGAVVIGSVITKITQQNGMTQRKRWNPDHRIMQLLSALEQTDDPAMITDLNGNIEYVNPSFERITGYRKDEVLGASSNIIRSGRQRSSFYNRMWQTLLAGQVFSDTFANRRRDGTLYYEEKTITPLRDTSGNITHFVGVGKDVTHRVQSQERSQYLSSHDALTGLPSRALFMDRLEQALARARLHDRLLAIMLLDIDRLRNINNMLGQEAGDRVLKELANRLKRSIRTEDTVARLGDDEFAILLDDLSSVNDATPLARKIQDTLATPMVIDNRELAVTTPIGISLYATDGQDSDTLLKNADIAMYRAKDLGRNNFQFYSEDMNAKASERLTLENSLRQAFDREEFLLYYQPQINVESGAISGVEALLRWQHPELGMVSPGDFVPLLEETGLIVEAGEWALKKACLQACIWHDQGFSDLRISVNLSGRQFNDPAFVDAIERAVKESGIVPDRLELEITESVIMRNARTTVAALTSLGAMGVRLSIDDFGTGYSSLSYLKRFPIDTLKIDQSFIHDVTTDTDDAAIARAIIVLGQSLKLDVIAEGVETREQLEFLRSHQCHSFQGFLISRPLPADEFHGLLVASADEHSTTALRH